MKLLPYRRLVIKSPLPPEDVAQVLWNSVHHNPWAPTSGRLFEGSVTLADFQIERVTARHNTFIPQIHGSIVPDGSGSWISIRLLLHPASVIFLAAWHGTILLLGGVTAQWAFAGHFEEDLVVMLVAAFLLGWLLPSPFYCEAQKNKRMLLQLTRGTELAGNARQRPTSTYR